MNRISLKGVNLTVGEDNIRITADVSGCEPIWFEVDKRYQSMLDTESVDAFFILYVWLAMERGVELEVEGKVSKKLSQAVTEKITKMFLVLCPRLKDVVINVLHPETEWHKNNDKTTGTGFSGGVDSWYTALKAVEAEKPYSYFVFANTGQHGLHQINEVVTQRAEVAADALSSLERPLIVINTNIDDVYRERFQQRDVIGNIACVLMLQREISYYAYSSSYSPEESGIVEYYDMAIMDPFLLPLLSTERIEFASIGVGASRIDKLHYISTQNLFSGKIYVCIEKHLPIKNCGYCFKCRRTQLALESIGRIDLINDNFDMGFYMRRRRWLMVGLFASSIKDNLDLEVADELVRALGIRTIPYRIMANSWYLLRKYIPAGIRWRLESKAPYLF